MSELSYAQHAVWFTEQAGAAADAYRMTLAIEFGPSLDERALREACATVLRRHPVLRSAVSPQGEVPHLIEVADSIEIGDRIDDSPFDLKRGPLVRLALVRRTLWISAHHLVFDGESKDILVRELAAAYNGETLGAPPAGQEAIAAAERAHVHGLLPRARSFWQGAVVDADVVLPGLRTGKASVVSGRSHRIAVPQDLSPRLDRAAEKCGVTRFELLLTALHVLLARYGNEAAPVSVSLSTRTDLTRDTIGLFVNDLPLPVAPLHGTVADYASALRLRLRELYRLRPVPFTHAVPGGARPAPALTPLSVSYRRQTAQPRFDGVDAVVDWSPATGVARNLLHLLAVDVPGELRLMLQHDPALIDADAVERIGTHLGTVLEHMLDDPHAPVAEIPLLPAPEAGLVIGAWNDTRREFPTATVPEMFARQAAARPDALAIVDGADRLSYARLEAVSASIAAAVAARGAGPGSRVAICLPRGWRSVAAILGVMRAGAAYVPVDPSYPQARREHIIADAAPVLVIEEIPESTEPFQAPPVCADDLAYVIYTSGSTGRPKGVAVRHAALTNFLHGFAEAVPAGPESRWLGLTSLSFDISVLEMLAPLTTGATLVIAADALDGPAINRLIETERVTHVQATPSGWRILLDAGLPAIAVALAGGEALPHPLAQELLTRAGKLYNCYGPTENTVYSTVDDVGPGEVTIGRPIGNTTAYVLDACGHPAPIGLTGELCLGGAGLADGYLGQPSLTAQRFPGTPLGRLYRTGDLCSWQTDGRLRYHGRLDDQLKVRGHRVEPGEIVARLLEHPGVAEAAVALHGEQLVGYLVVTGEPPAAAELRAHVAAELPAAMVPTHWVTLKHLPRTPNGKLDRAALPLPQVSNVETASQPTDDVTAVLTGIWREVLGVAHVGPDDDLFDLGGHSLSVTRMASRISQRLGVQVPLDVFFDAPTIAEIAAYVRGSLAGAA